MCCVGLGRWVRGAAGWLTGTEGSLPFPDGDAMQREKEEGDTVIFLPSCFLRAFPNAEN